MMLSFKKKQASPENSNLEWYILNGILAAIVVNLTQPFAVKYLQRLGGTALHIALYNSLPGFVGMAASIIGALYMVRCQHKSTMRLTCEFTLISRVMMVLPVFFVLLPKEYAPLLFVLLIALRYFPEAVSQTGIQNLTGDVFSPEERSTAITKRNKYSVPASFLVTMISGFILQYLPKTDDQRMIYYQVFFVLASIFGVLEVSAFWRLKSKYPAPACSTEGWIPLLKRVLQNKAFMAYTASAIVFYFGWQMGWPLFSIYMVVDLGANEWWLSLVSVMSAAGMFASYSYWNRFIQKRGNAFVAGISTLGLSASPIFMAISKNMLSITILNFIIGVFVAGTITVLLNYLLEVAPKENRIVYVGLFNALTNLSLAISPIIGHMVYEKVGILNALYIVAIVRLSGAAIFFLSHKRKSASNAN